MKKKNKMFLASSIFGLVIAMTAVFCGSIIKSPLMNNAKAAKEYSVKYSRETGVFNSSGNVYTTSCDPNRENISYLKCVSEAGGVTGNRIASFPSKNESSLNDTVLTFVTKPAGESSDHFRFQFLKSITANITSSNEIVWKIEQSFDAETWIDAGTLEFSNKTGTSASLLGAKYIRITETKASRAALMNYYVTDITLVYECDKNNPVNTLSSLEVGDKKTSYKVGDEFVKPQVNAVYYGEEGKYIEENVSATFSGYDMSTAGNQTVQVSYSDNGITKTISYPIVVEGDTPASISGKYTSTYTEIDFDNYVYKWGSFVIHFTFESSTSSITFKLAKQDKDSDYDDFGNYRLFKNETTDITNTTTEFVNNDYLKINLYNMFGSTKSYKFTKSAS